MKQIGAPETGRAAADRSKFGASDWIVLLVSVAYLVGATAFAPELARFLQAGTFNLSVVLCSALSAVAFAMAVMLVVLRSSLSPQLFVASGLIALGAFFATGLSLPTFFHAQVAAATVALIASYLALRHRRRVSAA